MEEITSDSTSIKYEIEVNGNNIIFNSTDISLRGTAYFSDGIFTGKYQNIERGKYPIFYERDSLFQSTEKEFIMKYDTIIPSIWNSK